MLVPLAWTGPPALAHKLTLAGTTVILAVCKVTHTNQDPGLSPTWACFIQQNLQKCFEAKSHDQINW